MEKYLITGFSGFVAKHFLDYLDSLNVPVLVLGIDINAPSFDINEFKNIKCTYAEINLLDVNSLSSELAGFSPDYILHLASFSSVAFSWEQPVHSIINNLNIFLNLVDQVRLLKLKCRILSVGSSEEYGKVAPDSVPLKEHMQVNPVSPYAVARVSQELLSKIYSNAYKLDIIITRSFNHIGPGQSDKFVVSSFAKKLLEAKNEAKRTISVGNVDIIRDFVDVRDVVRAYYLLLKKGIPGEIYNICSGKGYSLREIIHKLSFLLSMEISLQVDDKLVRPADNEIIIGSYKKINDLLAWSPSISIDESLQDIIKFWEGKLSDK
ncbi:MAG: GDP-mannose 4,6-dehydratase [Ferruginibacter sp.]